MYTTEGERKAARAKSVRQAELTRDVKRTARRKTDPQYAEQERARLRAWFANNPVAAMLSGAKWRAKKLGISCTIKRHDIESVWPTDNLCPVFGVEMVRGTLYAPSLDKWDNTKGYVPANIRIISRRANELKKDATPFESRALADYQNGGQHERQI